MHIIGEKINGTRKSVREAVMARDADFIKGLACAQADAGANRLDVNAGTAPEREPEDMQWLVHTIQSATDVPLCIDSPNVASLAAGLEVVKGQAMVNSTTFEKERAEAVIPLAAKHKALLVGLTIDDSGMPSTTEARVEIAGKIIEKAKAAGIPGENIYIDPLVRAIATENEQGVALLNATRIIREKFAPVHVVYGLSNISFGLPARHFMNRIFFAMAMACGLDAAIMDPTEKQIMAVLRAAEAIMGQDDFCVNYLSAFREGLVS
jgi:cobalamin-dependent methionine synthase I